jgi:hypothetical protein
MKITAFQSFAMLQYGCAACGGKLDCLESPVVWACRVEMLQELRFPLWISNGGGMAPRQ